MLYRLSLIMLVTSLAGCSLTKPMAVPTIAKYTINQTPVVAKSPKHSNKTMMVALMKSASGYHTTDMLYMTDPYRLQAFAKNEWNAAPASMLQPLLVESLRNAEQFRAVLSAPSTATTDYRLDTTLLKLQQEISGKTANVRLEIDASVIQTQTNHVIANQRFEIVVPSSPNPVAGVEAANSAAKQLLDKIVCFTNEVIR